MSYQSRYTGPEIDRRLGLMAGNFLHIRWSAAFPVVDMVDEPADYIGIFTGEEQDPPSDPMLYKWYLYKGSKGDTGAKGDTGDRGADGTGNNWYEGTAITGTSTTPAAYATGIANALVGDMYINKGTLPDTGRVYRCATGGDAATALWVYSMLLRGADGAGSGDMLKSVYDPTNKNADAFSLANMEQDATHRVVTDEEKAEWDGKAASGLLVSGLALPTTGYSGSGPYIIDIPASGVTTGAGKSYYIDAVFSDTDATRELEQTAWNLIIDRKIPSDNTLRLKLSAVPETAVTFYLKEVV